MTVIPLETAVVSDLLCDLSAAPSTTQQVVSRGLIRSLHLIDPDYQESIDSGLTESYEAYCIRLAAKAVAR